MTDRAEELFDLLSRRYLAFLDRLPQTVREAGLQRMSYSGDKGEGEFQGLGDLNPVLVRTPWHFWEQFGSLDEERFLDIAEAGACTVIASILLDHLVDGHAHGAEAVTLLQQVLYAHGSKLYRTIFPRNSPFWVQFSRLSLEHLAGLSLEVRLQLNPRRVEYHELERMAQGKVSPVVITLAALAEATGQPSVLEPIETSLKEIALASQLLDDVGDWRQDLAGRHLTYFLTQLADPGSWSSESWPPVDELQASLEATWADLEHLAIVRSALERSKLAVGSLDCSGWVDYVESYQTLADEHTTASTARHLARTLRAAYSQS